MLAAAFLGAVSLLLPGPVVAVASDGPWVGIAEGRSAADCDRVSVWNTRRPTAFRLGRATRCTPGSGIASISVARDRALWLHHDGANLRTWTLWTATTKRRTPRLLAKATADAAAAPPIVIGPGQFDKRLGYGDGDVLPYAIGRSVVVLKANGAVSFRWTAPTTVTALGSDPGILVVAVADGRIFRFEDGKLAYTYPGTVAASRVFWSDGLVDQRGTTVEMTGGLCTASRTLRSGQQLVTASAGYFALAGNGKIELDGQCGRGGHAIATGTAAALDNARFTIATGRRVISRLLS